jgi:hypothetical protein
MFFIGEVQIVNPLKFNSTEIEKSFQEKGIYEKDSFIIKLWTYTDQNEEKSEEAEENLMFAIQNKDKNLPFLGVVNYLFKREGYCLNSYINGDIYFGYYKNDQRNKQGIYEFKLKKEENKILYQYYYRLWKNDLFNGFGIYLWLKENDNKIPFNDFENSNFYAFVGISSKGVFENGALLSKENNNYSVYFGTFSPTGKKEGKNCFYYNSNLEELCYGTYKHGKFIEGFVCKFNQNGVIKMLIKYTKNKIKKTSKIKNINPNEEKNSKTLTMIRNVLMSKDYFGIIYEEIGKIIKFRNEKMNNIDMIYSDKYVQVMGCFSTFNQVSLFKDIEKNVEFFDIDKS